MLILGSIRDVAEMIAIDAFMEDNLLPTKRISAENIECFGFWGQRDDKNEPDDVGNGVDE